MATGYLGSRKGVAKLSTDQDANPYGTGLWMATFGPEVFSQGGNDFVIYHMAVQGPAGSELSVFTDATFYDTTPRGDINSWDANAALYMIGGQTLFYYWNSAALPAWSATPVVTVWIRQPGSAI